MAIAYSSAVGSYVFDGDKLIAKVEFNIDQSMEFAKALVEGKDIEPELRLRKTYNATKATEKDIPRIRELLSSNNYIKQLAKINLQLTADKLRNSVTTDMLIINAINNIEELTKISNTLAKRVREWYALHLPEACELIDDNVGFIKAISKKTKHDLMRELGIKESIGAKFEKKDLQPILSLAETILDLLDEKRRMEMYLEEIMVAYCRNMTAVTGSLISAKLIREAGSLERLAKTTSSTIQMLGAEKALFRHLKNKKALPPKHGHIINHPIMLRSKKKDKGRIARFIADKLSLAAKLDYFKGEFLGDKLRKEMEEKFQ
ncbi:MAG: NOP58 family protein [Nanoarchaeota archaeon]|nr:NOP58 family protein [Nanoarchaeota archaeon]